MKLGVYTVYDKKVGAYMTPIFSHNHETALRSIRMACADERSPFFHAPEDYSLNYVGQFCDESGAITPTTPEIIANLDQLSLIEE